MPTRNSINCNKNCTGDSSQIYCGGSGAVSVFSTGYFPPMYCDCWGNFTKLKNKRLNSFKFFYPILGDPHCTTFNKNAFTFMGRCIYDFVTTDCYNNTLVNIINYLLKHKIN